MTLNYNLRYGCHFFMCLISPDSDLGGSRIVCGNGVAKKMIRERTDFKIYGRGKLRVTG